MIAQAMRAALLAIATVATRTGFRASKSATYGSTLSGLYFARLTSEVMPTIKQLAQILVAHLADPSLPLLAAARLLQRRQPEPRSELAART